MVSHWVGFESVFWSGFETEGFFPPRVTVLEEARCFGTLCHGSRWELRQLGALFPPGVIKFVSRQFEEERFSWRKKKKIKKERTRNEMNNFEDHIVAQLRRVNRLQKVSRARGVRRRRRMIESEERRGGDARQICEITRNLFPSPTCTRDATFSHDNAITISCPLGVFFLRGLRGKNKIAVAQRSRWHLHILFLVTGFPPRCSPRSFSSPSPLPLSPSLCLSLPRVLLALPRPLLSSPSTR